MTSLLPDQCHFVYAPRQLVMMLQCNVFSHWLGSCREWSLPICTDLSSSVLSPQEYIQTWWTFQYNLQRIQVMEHIKKISVFFRPQWVNPSMWPYEDIASLWPLDTMFLISWSDIYPGIRVAGKNGLMSHILYLHVVIAFIKALLQSSMHLHFSTMQCWL